MNSSSSSSEIPLSPLEEGLEYIDRQLRELMFYFAEVLEELGEGEIAATLPWISSKEKKEELFSSAQKQTLSPSQLQGWQQACSISFQLLNLVEAHAASRARERRQYEGGAVAEPGLWPQQLWELQEKGFSDEQIATFLPRVHVEPVFTAHPTEAKRGAVLEQHRILCHLLSQGENRQLTPIQKGELVEQIKLSLEKLWRSGEVFLAPPTLADERRGILFYLRDVLPAALPMLEKRLQRAWRELSFDTRFLDDFSRRPLLSFGTWVGGDRDGHPFVTPSVTEETLMALRRGALILLEKELGKLAHSLPLSQHFQKPQPDFILALNHLKKRLGAEAEEIARRHPHEPWRLYVLLLQRLLPLRLNEQERYELCDSEKNYSSPKELLSQLEILRESLLGLHGDRLVREALLPVIQIIQVFGFHLATLDIRQNSAFHDQAVAQILELAGIDQGSSFPEWEEERRLLFLRKELATREPLLQADQRNKLGKEAQSVLGTYDILRAYQENFSAEGLGSLIVSMTRQLSDLLVVTFLAREAQWGSWREAEKPTYYLPVAIVPLFETVNDLENSPQLIEQYLKEPSTQAFLATQQKSSSALEVMVGYSDSNKDSGIMASQWHLYEAQRLMSEVVRQAGYQIRFFHGRGGTISRGAGPTHRFLEALAPGSLGGDLRMTEQGETIAQKYDHPTTATYHLELLLAGVTRVAMSAQEEESPSQPAREIASFLAQKSREIYHDLITQEGFLTFYQEATPIDALEVSRIGSRPKRRTSSSRSLDDLRAIPWVFSWNQSRYYLPGWFGIGSALTSLQQEKPNLWKALLQEHRQWPFLHYVLSNVETNIASADLSIMHQYAMLVQNQKIRDSLFNIIAAEFHRTQDQLTQLFVTPFQERRPRTFKTISLRQEPLSLLHQKQISLLHQWRSLRFSPQADQLLPKILLSVNGIASGLRTTG